MKPRPASPPDVELRDGRVDESLSHSRPSWLLDLCAIASFLSGIGVSTVERLMPQRLPYLDLDKHHPKRLLCFDPAEVLEWVRQNRRNGVAR